MSKIIKIRFEPLLRDIERLIEAGTDEQVTNKLLNNIIEHSRIYLGQFS